MSKFEPAEKLRNHRPLLLAVEAIGWLHMAGKAKADFLRGQGDSPMDTDTKPGSSMRTRHFPGQICLDG